MAGKKSSLSPLQHRLGNCSITVEGSRYKCWGSGPNLEISVANAAKIKLFVDGENDNPLSHFSFVLVNPKDVDSHSKSLLQEALRLYVKELPTMNYAANTGKESDFLERCVSSGKYCTLLMQYAGALGEVIAAVTYQIIPADTQYAEIPVAAVSSSYQHKGVGRLLYTELRKRLQNVGICKIFCWGDRESKGFWIKQGFEIIAEVNAKGKVCRIPIKANIRKALCFPGGSSLMLSHLNKTANPSSHLEPQCPIAYRTMPSSHPVKTHELAGTAECNDTSKSNFAKDGLELNEINPQVPTDAKVFDGSSPVYDSAQNCEELAPLDVMNYKHVAADATTTKSRLRCAKRKTWETSVSSIKSKKIKGGHHIDHSCQEFRSEHDKGNDSYFSACSLSGSKDNASLVVVPYDSLNNVTSGDHLHMGVNCKDSLENSCKEMHTEKTGPSRVIANEDYTKENPLPDVGCHKIMLMDIADDAKKTFLTKIIEDLGGAIASEGSACTHVITGKTRKTLNFCVALCSGAWVISTDWLKKSFREGRFVDEMPFVLEDREYALKYKSELKDAVLRAKACPRALLEGYDIYLAKHVQPPVNTLLAIVKSAGGNVVKTLSKVKEPSRTIFVACEEDMEEAMLAAERGIWTFSSDWFMGCIMRQELDMQAPQFAESL